MLRTLHLLLLGSILLTTFILTETKQDNEFAEFDGESHEEEEEFENNEVSKIFH